jgi:Holliday junction DNA helicase RuvA
MIAEVSGVLADKSPDAIVIRTEGGVGYEITVPLGVFERLPAEGSRCTLHTALVVKEDGWSLFGFDTAGERHVFQRLLGASGFGPKLAIALLSSLGPERTVRSIKERDLAALSTVSGIGRKKAERLVLELSDRFGDVVLDSASGERPRGGADAVRALENLGYNAPAAEDAVRLALEAMPGSDTAAVVRAALKHLMSKGGRS